MGDCSNGNQSGKYWSKNHVMVVREDGILSLQSGLEIHVPALHTDLAGIQMIWICNLVTIGYSTYKEM
jgi:hypothetical protein